MSPGDLAKERRLDLGHEVANSGLVDPGRLPRVEGIDYKRAAIEYTSRLDEERLHYLRTKPFYNLANKPPKFAGQGMDVETHRHFCDFANIAVALELPPGARILDTACGSGWLSEYFARLGYDVTGIDISPALIRLCEDRLRKVPYGTDHRTAVRCRFLTHDIESAPLDQKFDAIVCYDAMHHFGDEGAATRHFAAMLNIGGLLFILEGDRPPAGSAAEAELIGVMREYQVLESPYEADYLRRLLDQAGFRVVGDYVSVNGLVDRDAVDENGRVRLPLPPVNYFLCKKVAVDAASTVPDSRSPQLLRARFELLSKWPLTFAKGEVFSLHLRVQNAGDTVWLGGGQMRRGAVMLGIKIIDAAGAVVDEFHGQPPLPRALAPGEQTDVIVTHQLPELAGDYIVKIDLVNQYVCWFADRGSETLDLGVAIR